MKPGKERAETIVESLLARGLVSAEDAAALAARDLGPDPVTSVLRSGLVDLSNPGALKGLLDGLPGARLEAVTERDVSGPAAGDEMGHVEPWQSALAGRAERFELDRVVRVEGETLVHEAVEHDLARPVEMHVGPAEAVAAVGALLARLAGPGVATPLDRGRMPDGRAFLVTNAPPGGLVLALPDKRAAAAALARIARVLHRCHGAGVLHVGLDPDLLFAGEEGVVQVSGWGGHGHAHAHGHGHGHGHDHDHDHDHDHGHGHGHSHGHGHGRGRGGGGSSAEWKIRDAGETNFRAPELDHGREAGAEADVYSLGKILGVLVERSRALPPELRHVASRGAARRPSARYRSAEELALDIERALAGERVLAGPSPVGRRLARFGRHHPYLTLAALFAVAATLLGFVVFGLERSRIQLEEAKKEETRRRDLLVAAGQALGQAKDAEKRLAERLVVEKAALGKIQDARQAAIDRFRKRDPGEGEVPAEADRKKQALDEAALEARTALDQVLATAKTGLSAIEKIPGDEAGRVARELRAVALAASLARFRADVERGRFEEDREFSSRTISTVRARSEPPWVAAAAVLEGLVGLLGETPDEVAAARKDLSTRGRIVIAGEPPPGVTLSIYEVARDPNHPGRWALTEPPSELEAGDYLVELTDGEHTVRHEVLLAAGESYEYAPDWPAEWPPGQWPPGEWAYVPAGRFRAGGEGANAGPYREERVERGFFIATRETTLGEYREFLRAVGARDELLPRIQWTNEVGYLVRSDLSLDPRVASWYKDYMPMGGLSQEMAKAYATWRTRTLDAGWECRLPTEDEWEAAARGASGRAFPWGDVFDPTLDQLLRRGQPPWYVRAGDLEGKSIHGLANAAGNVREWTGSDYGAGLVTIRGGWCDADEAGARVAARVGLHPRVADAGRGVRVVCSPPGVR